MNIERDMLGHYRTALHALAANAETSVGPTYAGHIKEMVDQLDREWETLMEQERQQILIGRGELAMFKLRLGLSKGYGKNLLEHVPKEDQLSKTCVYRLIEEFLNIGQTGLKRGGVYKLAYKTNEKLPTDPDKLRGGIYRVPGALGREYPCLTIQLIEKGVVSFLFIVLKNETFDPIQLKMVTHVDAEQAWVSHEYFGVVSRKVARTGMINTIKKFGAEVVMPVPLSKIHTLIKERLKPREEQSHRYLTIEFQGYRVMVNWIVEGADTPRYQVTIQDIFHHNSITGAVEPKSILWHSLNTAKQFQLFKEVEKKIEDLTA
jgi:hypothetical protein